MARLGISIYPDKVDVETNKKYIDLAVKHGFKRVFTCLLSPEGDPKEIKAMYAEVCGYARDKGMEVIIDVAPNVFERFGITYDDLSFFHDIHVDGIRLDEGFDGQKEAMMTYNPYGLKIEFNASILNKYIDNIISFHGDPSKMIACHNFYPQKYTGLGLQLFNKCNQQLKEKQLRVAAFVTSQNKEAFGPWPVTEGLCTLEMHRELPLELQARHLFATKMVDDVIISNCFPAEEEMIALGKLNPSLLTFKMEEAYELSAVEKAIIYEFNHHVRGDMSDYMARSTFPRITYASADIPPRNTRDLKRGDVVVLNNGYGRYKGELHIIMQDMPNEGNKNVVGTLSAQEQILMEFIEPFRPFAIIK
ncbi:MAG: DUF871 domain-containing protein [Erysipelotrichaceae bacterium]